MNEEIDEISSGTNWVVRSEINQNVFNIPLVTVSADTKILHNSVVQEKMQIDSPVAFVFGSVLRFQPTLDESKLDGIRKIVKYKSKTKFKETLEDNNIKSVRMLGSEKRTTKGIQINTHQYKGIVQLDNNRRYDIEAYCMILHDNKSYHIIGFAEPSKSINNLFDLSFDISPRTMTERYLDKIIDN